ncbi:MAG: S24 family peptidase, partial [Clostridia bacterium]
SVTCNEDVPCDFALRVKGDSMNPRLFDNDVVFIRSQPDVHDGQIAAVMVDDSATLKHVYHIAGGVQLVSDNADYAPMTFTAHNSESISILGLAVAYQRRLNQRQA